jgi:hypothetical protein
MILALLADLPPARAPEIFAVLLLVILSSWARGPF